MSQASPLILLVDDDPVCRDITRRILSHELKEFNLELREATNGAEGLELAKTIQPNLILMDIAMPVLSGTGAIERLKADPETASIPVLAVTAMVLPRERDNLLSIGFDGYIPKPINYDALVEQVRSYLDPSG
ncbi:response regulator [bacterium]|nr:response regulator [bacterium]